MKVLWFEISEPRRYAGDTGMVLGWQDSLEEIIRNYGTDIELGVAFETSDKSAIIKQVDGINYFPICGEYSSLDKIRSHITWNLAEKRLLPKALKIIKHFRPDIIHIFGSEWSWGLISKQTTTPIVIHMQGSIPPYNNAKFPPGYSIRDKVHAVRFNPFRIAGIYARAKKDYLRQLMEEDILRSVNYFMGRTEWDKSIVELFNPNSTYFHVEEALRPLFYKCSPKNDYDVHSTLRLITVGCGTHWKGCDTILRTAKLLKDRSVDFEWKVVGRMNIQKEVEKKEKMTFAQNNVEILGFQSAASVIGILKESDIYIHTAYIDNSPNSICEAQYLGLPIISTNVGGIPSLIDNNKDGILIPANDPYILAYKIINLSKDMAMRVQMGQNSNKRAVVRHSEQNIYKQLLNCYVSILQRQK